MDLVEFLTARLDEDAAVAKDVRHDGWTDYDGWAELDQDVKAHAWRHDPTRVLAEVAVKRRIIELHTTGNYRTYDCSNADHIQEWQCKRAKEPYVEHRYCEVCGGGSCEELPLLAGIYESHPDFRPEWWVTAET